MKKEVSSNGRSIAAMVLGIISLLTSLIWFFSLIVGIIAIVFASLSMKNNEGGRGMAIAGLVTGILGVLGSLFWMLIFILAFSSAPIA